MVWNLFGRVLDQLSGWTVQNAGFVEVCLPGVSSITRFYLKSNVPARIQKLDFQILKKSQN